jgi:hypothetical protein
MGSLLGVKMPIRIEFITENQIAGSTHSALLSSMSTEMIETACFVMPVRFRVGEVDLFEKVSSDHIVYVCPVERDMLEGTENSEGNSPWSSLPLVHVATVGFERVRKVCRGERETAFYNLPGGGTLQIHSADDQVEISSSLSKRSVKAGCSELLEAFKDFSNRVRRFIIQEAPELQDHPAWKNWFEIPFY